MKKRILICIGTVLGTVFLLLAGLIAFLSVTEYKPADIQPAEHIVSASGTVPVGQSLTVCSWNIGYGGLGKESDFFMDGGSMVDPPSQDTVRKNLEGIRSFIANTPADVWLFQEVDVDSARTGRQNQFPILLNSVQGLGGKVIPIAASMIELVGKFAAAYWLAPMLGYLGICLIEPITWAASLPIVGLGYFMAIRKLG